eukprot:gene6826-7593_t
MMSVIKTEQAGYYSSNSISSPELQDWSPSTDTSSNDDNRVLLQPASPTLPLIRRIASDTRPPLPTRATKITKVKNFTNKKERCRTESINTAFADLRGCIPNVPTDTKLSKIKTLRLAISYIQYLMQQLQDNRHSVLVRNDRSFYQQNYFCQLTRQINVRENVVVPRRMKRNIPEIVCEQTVRKKGRTGWPQYVWALELKR